MTPVDKMRLFGQAVLISADYWSVILAEAGSLGILWFIGIRVAISSWIVFFGLPIAYILLIAGHHGYNKKAARQLLNIFVVTTRDCFCLTIILGFFSDWLSVEKIYFLMLSAVIVVPMFFIVRRWFYNAVNKKITTGC